MERKGANHCRSNSASCAQPTSRPSATNWAVNPRRRSWWWPAVAVGHPLVIRNAPIDADGHPFPTTYWLTCPDAVKAVSRVESEGWIAQAERPDPGGRGVRRGGGGCPSRVRRRSCDRTCRPAGGPRAWGGVAGTRTGVKCLHAHYAYHLAGGADPIGAWVAERVEPVHPGAPVHRVAAIDQGTNSIRLLVVDGDGTELARDMVITRLGQGVDRTGRLDPDALARTIEVLAIYCRRARALGADRIRVAATSAVRDADNREVFEAAVLRARRVHPGGDHGRTGSRAVLPRCDAWARARRWTVPGAGHRRWLDRVRHRQRTRASPSMPSPPRWGASVSPNVSSPTTHRRPDELAALFASVAEVLAAGGARCAAGADANVRRRGGHGDDRAGDQPRARPLRPRSDPPIVALPGATPSGCSTSWRR